MKSEEFNKKLYSEVMGTDKQKAYEMLQTKFINMPLQNRKDMQVYIDGLEGKLIKIIDVESKDALKDQLRTELKEELRAELKEELEKEIKAEMEAEKKAKEEENEKTDSLSVLEVALNKATLAQEKDPSAKNKKAVTSAKIKLGLAKKKD